MNTIALIHHTVNL